MPEPLILREDEVPAVLVVVRLGSRTLDDSHPSRAVEETHGRWGVWGFSVLEVPDGDYERLARLRPIVRDRKALFVADGHELIGDGVPLLPTLDHPHWTVVLSALTAEHFASVCGPSSADRSTTRPGATDDTGTLGSMAESSAPYDLWYDPNAVGGDLVVETWISHGPHAGDDEFAPQPGDVVLAGDDEARPLQARVIRRDADRVWIQLHLADHTHAVAQTSTRRVRRPTGAVSTCQDGLS